MKFPTLLILGAGGYIAYKLFAQSTAASQLKYFVKNITYGESTLGYTTLIATVTVENPSNQNLRFNKFFCRILVNGSELANTTITDQGTPISLKPGTTDLKIPIKVGHLAALQNLASIIQDIIAKRPISTPVTITGLLYAANLQLPVTQTMTITPQGISGIGAVNNKGIKITYSSIDRLFYVYATEHGKDDVELWHQRTKPTMDELKKNFVKWIKNKAKQISGIGSCDCRVTGVLN